MKETLVLYALIALSAIAVAYCCWVAWVMLR
jgi:hypothetical protein